MEVMDCAIEEHEILIKFRCKWGLVEIVFKFKVMGKIDGIDKFVDCLCG